MRKKVICLLAVALTLQTAHCRCYRSESDSLEFDKMRGTSPSLILKGKESGVRVSSTGGSQFGAANIHIRGINSVRSDSNPVWIVDGLVMNSTPDRNTDAFWQKDGIGRVPAFDGIAFLPAYDIESIKVLKNLSETARYGILGADGVILVNTMRRSDSKHCVEWHSNVGVNMPNSVGNYFGNAFTHNHDIKISGSRNGTSYLFSGDLRRDGGIVSGSGSKMGSIRAAFETMANSTVQFGLNTSVGMSGISSMTGASWVGTPKLMTISYAPSVFSDDSEPGWMDSYGDNMDGYRLTTAAFLNLYFTPSLSLKNNLGYDFGNSHRYVWFGDRTSFGDNVNGAASVLVSRSFKSNASSTLTYDRFIAAKHHVTVTAGVEYNGFWTDYNTLNGTDFFSKALRGKGINLMGSKAEIQKYAHKNNEIAAVGTVSYDANGYVSSALTFRGDNNSRYDDNRLRTFIGADCTANLKKILGFDRINSLNINVGYGEAGKEVYVPYGLFSSYSGSGYPVAEEGADPFYEALCRISSKEYHINGDFSTFNGRLSVGLEYYNKLSDDALTFYCFGKKGATYWRYSSREEIQSQLSSVSNRGLEAELNVVLIKRKDSYASLSINATYNNNQIWNVATNDSSGCPVGDNLVANANVLGISTGSLYGFKTLGIISNENIAFAPDFYGEAPSSGNYFYEDKTGDNNISDVDKQIIGNPFPKIFGGSSFDLRIKRFTFELTMDAALGFDILNLNRMVAETRQPYIISDAYIEKGDWIKLSRVSASFDLPTKAFAGKGILKAVKSLRFSLSAFDLLVLTDYSGFTPEANTFGMSTISSGIDYGSLPIYKTFIAGISARF